MRSIGNSSHRPNRASSKTNSRRNNANTMSNVSDYKNSSALINDFHNRLNIIATTDLQPIQKSNRYNQLIKNAATFINQKSNQKPIKLKQLFDAILNFSNGLNADRKHSNSKPERYLLLRELLRKVDSFKYKPMFGSEQSAIPSADLALLSKTVKDLK